MPKEKWEDKLRNIKDPSGIQFIDKLGQNEVKSIEKFIKDIRKKDKEELIGKMSEEEPILSNFVSYFTEQTRGKNEMIIEIKKLITEHYN